MKFTTEYLYKLVDKETGFSFTLWCSPKRAKELVAAGIIRSYERVELNEQGKEVKVG